jgi:hypothetical protein
MGACLPGYLLETVHDMPPSFPEPAVRRPWREETPEGLPYPTCAACPDRALPRYALLRAAVAGHCWRWGRRWRTVLAAAAGGGRPRGRGENAVSFSYPSNREAPVKMGHKSQKRQ